MNSLGFFPAGAASFAGVAFCAWMFFTSALYQKTNEGRLEMRLPRDGAKRPWGFYEAQENLRLQLRYDPAGRLRRWVGGQEVHSDEELMAAIVARRHERWDLPVGIDALLDMSWGEIVRTMGLLRKHGFEVEFFAPKER